MSFNGLEKRGSKCRLKKAVTLIYKGIKPSSFTRNAYVATSRETRCCAQVVKANSSAKWDAKLGVPPPLKLTGTLINDDENENITKKMSLRPFKLYRVYLEPPN